MAISLICIFASLLIFIILTETLTIYISQRDHITAYEIHFIVFAIVLRKEKQTKKHYKKRFSDNKNKIFKSFLPKLIKSSEITVNNIEIYLPSSNPFADALRHGIYSSFLSSLIAFGESNTHFFKTRNIKLINSEHNKITTFIDIKFKITLLDALICFVLYLCERIFKGTRRKTYVRKQNE